MAVYQPGHDQTALPVDDGSRRKGRGIPGGDPLEASVFDRNPAPGEETGGLRRREDSGAVNEEIGRQIEIQKTILSLQSANSKLQIEKWMIYFKKLHFPLFNFHFSIQFSVFSKR
jgi:hypothetical protein